MDSMLLASMELSVTWDVPTTLRPSDARDILAEIKRLREALKKYADRNNWSPLDEHGYNRSEWLPEQEGWKPAEEALQGSLADETRKETE